MSNDIKELIDRLRTDSLDATKASLSIMDLCMEAADVVEVVRCGQCFYSAHEGELWICVHPDQYCDCVAKIVNPGYFCGYGRRIGVVDDNSDT